MTNLYLADQSARQRALHPGKSFIVQAPAGSGKTGLLVRRFLTLLSIVDQPEEMVAITFTRKATAEMQERVLQALTLARNKQPQERELQTLADAALRNNDANNWKIIENPDRLRILTIDAFAYELVRHMPWSARFGATPEILEDSAATKLYAAAARRTLDHINQNNEWSDHCANIFRLTDVQFESTETLISNMLGKRDRWMRGLKFDTRDNFETMWQQVIEQQLQSALLSLDDALQAEILRMLQFSAANMDEKKPDENIARCVGLQQFPSANYEDLPLWQGVASLLLTLKGGLRKTVNKNNGFPANLKQQKEHMIALLNSLADYPEVVQSLSVIPALPEGRFSEEQWQTLQSLLKLLPVAAAELRLLFKETNLADYIEITQRAESALGEVDNPSDLALAADHKIKHILMDEVQDTSKAQVDLIRDLTRGWTGQDSRTLFFVGDPMQSIYRFREAEVGNFLQIQQSGIGQIQPETLILQSNFRSSATLVDWFNTTFAKIFPAKDDIVNSAIAYSPGICNETDEATDTAQAVKFHAQRQNSAEDEALAISRQVAQTQRDNPTYNIGILGRSRKHLKQIAKALRLNGIPYQAIELEPLIDRPAILDLVSLTRAINRLSDRIAWLSILRAPWCGLGLADITRLSENNPNCTIFESIKLELERDTLSAAGKTRLTKLYKALSLSVAQSGRQSLRKTVYTTWFRLGGHDCIRAEEIQDCESYFELLNDLEQQQTYLNAQVIIEAIHRKWSQSNIQAQTQLLTIHKAKGLEFDVVILPMLNSKSRGDDREIMRWTRLSEQLLISVLPHSHSSDDHFYNYLGILEKRRQKNELCRLLYVACTRAKRKLHLYANLKLDTKGEIRSPESNSLWQLLEPVFKDRLSITPEQRSEYLSEDLIEKNENPLPKLFRRLDESWRLNIPETLLPVQSSNSTLEVGMAANTIEFSWAGETARISGLVIHHCLQHIEASAWKDWKNQNTLDLVNANKSLLQSYNLNKSQQDQAQLNLTSAINNIKSDSKADWIFSSKHREIKSEWPLTAFINEKIISIVIDRSFVDSNDTRWIIDFKSSRHEDSDIQHFLDNEKLRYQNQLQRYAEVLALVENRKTRLGLYFPLHKGWREWAA